MPGEHRTRELRDDILTVTHLVDDSHDGWRADNFLRVHYKTFSRNKIQQWIDDGRIAVVGRTVLKASTSLKKGERIQVVTEWDRLGEPPVDLSYKVLFEDEHVMVIDKPGNLPVHPAGKFLFNTLQMDLKRKRPDEEFFLVHRLDRETSGVLLLGRTSEVTSQLIRQFFERATEKRYYAVAHGHLPQPEITVDADMGSAVGSQIRLKMAAFPKGTGEMDALTIFRVARSGNGVDLVDCELKTGRQHQIRVHLAHLGHPVVGDKLYGPDENTFIEYLRDRKAHLGTRHALHSRYLKFRHPVLDKWMEIESPLPADMEALLK